jgi:acyl-CoA thioester hydrolase
MGWREITRGVIMPWECDDNGHLAARYYLPKFDDSSFVILFGAGIVFTELRKRGLSMVTVSHKLRYLAELRSESIYVIEAAIIHVGRSSIHVAQRMHDADGGRLAATLLGVDALFDLEARASVPWPDDIRSTIRAALTTLSDEDRALLER